MATFDLLIIYNDGVVKIIKDVIGYGCKREYPMFYFKKNNGINYIPVENVRYFGNCLDYMDGDENENNR